MDRIIMDSFIKQDKKIYGEDRNHEFNQRILAVNQMYGWLEGQGILKKIAFAYQNCQNEIHFALDTADLEPFRKAMEESKLPNAELAVRHLLDEPYTPCVYSGAIQPGWLMGSYREMDGIVGRSWECELVKFLNAKAVNDVRQVQDSDGVKAAVLKVFSLYDWPAQNKEQLPEGQAAETENTAGVWLCVYKDVLGLAEDGDNLTEICVPRAWLLEVLKAEDLDPDTWFDEYTADDTQEIARKALDDKIILAYAEEKTQEPRKENVSRGRPEAGRLTSMLSCAENRVQRPNTRAERSEDQTER